jgi:hypothetical protein
MMRKYLLLIFFIVGVVYGQWDNTVFTTDSTVLFATPTQAKGFVGDSSALMLRKANNLSDLSNKTTARTNLQVYSTSSMDIYLGAKADTSAFKDSTEQHRTELNILNSHRTNTSNPHSVTASQVSLGNLTNKLQVEVEDSNTTASGGYITKTHLLANHYTESEVNGLVGAKADTARTITAGNGLSGGGSLGANRTLTANLNYNGGLEFSSDSIKIDLDGSTLALSDDGISVNAIPISKVTGAQDSLTAKLNRGEATTLLGTKAASVHAHAISDVTSLSDTLTSKINRAEVYSANRTQDSLTVKLNRTEAYSANAIDGLLDTVNDTTATKLNRTEANAIINGLIEDSSYVYKSGNNFYPKNASYNWGTSTNSFNLAYFDTLFSDYVSSTALKLNTANNNYHSLAVGLTYATNLNAFNFTNTQVNTNRTSVSTSRDTSAISGWFSASGSPFFQMKGKTGNSLFYVDSLGIRTATGMTTVPVIGSGNTGISFVGGSQFNIIISSIERLRYDGSDFCLVGCYSFGANAYTPDLRLYRDAANVLALRNGTNNQNFRLWSKDGTTTTDRYTTNGWGTGTDTLKYSIAETNTGGAVKGSFNATGFSSYNFDGLTNFTSPYVNLSDTTDQQLTGGTTADSIVYSCNDQIYGFTHTAGHAKVFATYSGKYLVTFSGIWQSSAPSKYFSVWADIDGANVPRSSTQFQLIGTNQNRVVTVTFIVSMTAGQYLKLWNWSDDANAFMDYTTAQVNPTRPVSPSIILTINKISD